MALKPDRFEDATDLSFFMNVTGERGQIVIHDTTGSGAGMDDATNNVKLVAGTAPSGTKPAGLLLCDVVNYDLTRQPLNAHKDEVQLGGKVLLLRRGYVVTNKVTGTITAGAPAYYDSNGVLTVTDPGSGFKVGRFLTKADADGYAKVEINITG